MDNDSVLTTQEVADMLKIAKNTVYELIKRGELNSYKVGKKVRIDLKDVIEYKNRTKTAQTIAAPVEIKSISPGYKLVSDVQRQNSFVICGQDILLDILSRYLQFHPAGFQALRSYDGSYNGLYALYHGLVQMTTVHLWDGETGQYNMPYVKRMLPGIPAVIVHLATRFQGFYVMKGNPKGIKGWEDLKRKDITFINREKGSGTRVLLDEQLKRMGLAATSIEGYHRESTSHLAIASTVARGGADIGLGNEKSALQVNGIDFFPLQTEQLDLVFKKEELEKPEFQAVLEIISNKEFQLELEGLGGYDINRIGEITEI
ncbi:MAG TPA: helix-turn-helix transcriptional regulator [Mobilitalea sp.]|nr:helix-turn-helix transcriptional regulator [Mobilitalea sp.]